MGEIAEISFVSVLFVGLLVSGMWIPLAVCVTASVYLYMVGGWSSFRAFGLISWGSMNNFTLTAIPLFIFMADLMLESGLSNRVYRGLSRLVSRLPGGLLQTNVAGCAIFSAISGSSVATAAAIGTVALPQLKERGYDPRLATGTLAAGGTLGILIPPSIALIVYGTFSETSITQLFMAGLLPGLTLTALFMGYVAIRALINPTVAPVEVGSQDHIAWTQVATDLLPFALLIFAVMGSLYAGIVTPTEAAAVGVVFSAIICFIWGDLSWTVFNNALKKTVRVTGAILFIVYSAFIFSYAIGMSGLPDILTEYLVELDLSYAGFLIALLILFTLMGCLVDSLGMMVITVPLLLPLLGVYGIDPLWFGVALVLLIELGQISPPLGLNLFVIHNISRGKLGDVILGSFPFFFLIYLCLGLLVLFPQLALWLPATMTR
uniref:TRAP transporter large permease n=1 Tax=Roseovarius indicus TaxID=540747 RepID=UPI003B529096